jgi:hypothetical protein
VKPAEGTREPAGEVDHPSGPRTDSTPIADAGADRTFW